MIGFCDDFQDQRQFFILRDFHSRRSRDRGKAALPLAM